MRSIKNKLKVLLVEDQKIVMKIHKAMLEEIGHTVNTAENGQQALSMARIYYDLISMDIGLPDISGIDVTAKIRKLEKGRRTPIIGLTAFLEEEVKNQCLHVGMDKVITKPVTSTTLEQIITTYTGYNRT